MPQSVSHLFYLLPVMPERLLLPQSILLASQLTPEWLLLLRGLQAEAQATLAVLILQEIETYSGLLVCPLAYSSYSKHILIQSL